MEEEARWHRPPVLPEDHGLDTALDRSNPGKTAPAGTTLGVVHRVGEIADLADLRVWLKVNGEFRQQSSTSNMIFDVPFLVSYLSRFMSLLPGDVVSTGTPGGVGLGLDPPSYLKAGDVVELGVDGLGQSTQRIVAYGD